MRLRWRVARFLDATYHRVLRGGGEWCWICDWWEHMNEEPTQ